MRRKKAYLFILLSLIPALAIPRLIRFSPLKPHVRIISLKAKKCGDSPGRIVVNKGDTAILKPTSLDVVHGFLLDGYPVDAILKQQGLALLKYHWTDDDNKIHTDSDKVNWIRFGNLKKSCSSGKFYLNFLQVMPA